ncbi:hypothetical protein F4802DRAFT_1807 [Xylaria palmicola]|nr:hypothetical protein F4802DRAFT_1807 [Xylaria palmicola]
MTMNRVSGPAVYLVMFIMSFATYAVVHRCVPSLQGHLRGQAAGRYLRYLGSAGVPTPPPKPRYPRAVHSRVCHVSRQQPASDPLPRLTHAPPLASLGVPHNQLAVLPLSFTCSGYLLGRVLGSLRSNYTRSTGGTGVRCYVVDQGGRKVGQIPDRDLSPLDLICYSFLPTVTGLPQRHLHPSYASLASALLCCPPPPHQVP